MLIRNFYGVKKWRAWTAHAQSTRPSYDRQPDACAEGTRNIYDSRDFYDVGATISLPFGQVKVDCDVRESINKFDCDVAYL